METWTERVRAAVDLAVLVAVVAGALFALWFIWWLVGAIGPAVAMAYGAIYFADSL